MYALFLATALSIAPAAPVPYGPVPGYAPGYNNCCPVDLVLPCPPGIGVPCFRVTPPCPPGGPMPPCPPGGPCVPNVRVHPCPPGHGPAGHYAPAYVSPSARPR